MGYIVVDRSLGEENIYMSIIYLGMINFINPINPQNKLKRQLTQSDSVRPHIHILYSPTSDSH